MDNPDNMSPEEIIELQKKNCIFCKIIHKEIPCYEIFSDDKSYVILDINPASEGHCIVLPKQHYQILPQIPDELIGHLSSIAKKASKALLKSLGVKGTTIFIANGAIAGQKAPHFMIHVIPRKSNDMLFQMRKNASDEKKLEEIRIKISDKMSSLTGKRQAENIPRLTNQTEQTKEKKQENKDDIREKKEEMDIDKISDLFG